MRQLDYSLLLFQLSHAPGDLLFDTQSARDSRTCPTAKLPYEQFILCKLSQLDCPTSAATMSRRLRCT